ncbi:hypothetical protein GCM10011391_13490 [Pullulanibacillus camelliae]|uniref:Uncharacterized protein n=1 Tax=Pullulanibacillus camelliae TaxID=1707096 RepID=A0A8J2VP90_9BACL|nr:hypothetical protein [Pullulanibacillus camelliae]GGE35991.1 hypothetical protein GCM10011391_13490 [Pullulanibacillus camelliae]
MRVNPFIARNYDSNIYKDNFNVSTLDSLDSDRSFTTEDDVLNQDTYKEQALRRSTSPILVHLSKQADGTITFDRQQMTREEVLSLREGDLKNVAINWAPLELQLASKQSSYSSTDQVAYDLDYFASEYVQFQSQINMRYSGKEQEEQLQKLDDMIYSHVEKYADQFSEMADTFFSENGININKDQFKDSIMDFFQQRKNAYADFIQENKDYAGIKGTENEWLLNDNQFMGEQLRYALDSKHPDVNFISSNGMSIDDLAAVGTVIKETKNADFNSFEIGHNKHRAEISYNKNKSEEEYGVKLGLTAMKYTLITENYHLSDGIKSKLDTAFDNFIKDQNERASDYVKDMQEDPFVRNNEAFAMDWDKELVSNIINKMVSHLQTTDINQSFKNDINVLIELYKSKTEDQKTSGLSRYQSYHNTWAEDNYVDDWNRFVNGLSLSTGIDSSQYELNYQVDLFDTTI